MPASLVFFKIIIIIKHNETCAVPSSFDHACQYTLKVALYKCISIVVLLCACVKKSTVISETSVG